jgi:cell division transport system permease protein
VDEVSIRLPLCLYLPDRYGRPQEKKRRTLRAMKPNATPVISSTVNNTLILFFVGLFFFIALAANVLVDFASNSLVVKVVVSYNMTKAEANDFIQRLMKTSYAERAQFVSKEEALQRFKDKADLAEVMGENNPLPATVELYVKKEYLNEADMEAITKKLVQTPEVYDVYYPRTMIKNVVENRALFQVLAGTVGLILIVVAFFLIMNTVQLGIYSKRMMIRSMQLIGATSRYIRAPFLRSGMLQGLVAGTLASALIFVLLQGLASFMPAAAVLIYRPEVFALYFCLILAGVLLGWFSSTVAVNRFLNKNLDEIV